MIHRHLNHQRLTRAAVDDIITRGALPDWFELRAAAQKTATVRQSVEAVCRAYAGDPYAQRHHFWFRYIRSLDSERAAQTAA
jgi:hypothetical protein